jgi:hypothetical protein
MCNEVKKTVLQYKLVLPKGAIYDVLLKVPHVAWFLPSSFLMIGSGIQVILRLLPQQFQRLQCWYY